MSQLAHFDFSVKRGQQIDTVLKVPFEERGAIHGVVVDECDKPVENAVVKLFEARDKKCGDKCELEPVTHAFTDECGQFLFGPLCPNKFYVIKVWFNDICTKEVKMEDEKKDNECLHEKKCDCADPCDKCEKCKEPCEDIKEKYSWEK